MEVTAGSMINANPRILPIRRNVFPAARMLQSTPCALTRKKNHPTAGAVGWSKFTRCRNELFSDHGRAEESEHFIDRLSHGDAGAAGVKQADRMRVLPRILNHERARISRDD